MASERETNQWQINPNPGRHKYFIKLNYTKTMLQGKGILPLTAVFVTENETEARMDGREPAVRDVEGWVAARNITEHDWRLSTPEEIERAKAARQESARVCAATTEVMARESSLRLTSAFLEAAAQLGPNPGGNK